MALALQDRIASLLEYKGKRFIRELTPYWRARGYTRVGQEIGSVNRDKGKERSAPKVPKKAATTPKAKKAATPEAGGWKIKTPADLIAAVGKMAQRKTSGAEIIDTLERDLKGVSDAKLQKWADELEGSQSIFRQVISEDLKEVLKRRKPRTTMFGREVTDFRDPKVSDRHAANAANKYARDAGLEQIDSEYDDWEVWRTPDGKEWDYGYDEETDQYIVTERGDWTPVAQGDWRTAFWDFLKLEEERQNNIGPDTAVPPPPAPAKPVFVGRSRATERGNPNAPRERQVQMPDGTRQWVEEGSMLWEQASGSEGTVTRTLPPLVQDQVDALKAAKTRKQREEIAKRLSGQRLDEVLAAYSLSPRRKSRHLITGMPDERPEESVVDARKRLVDALTPLTPAQMREENLPPIEPLTVSNFEDRIGRAMDQSQPSWANPDMPTRQRLEGMFDDYSRRAANLQGVDQDSIDRLEATLNNISKRIKFKQSGGAKKELVKTVEALKLHQSYRDKPEVQKLLADLGTSLNEVLGREAQSSAGTVSGSAFDGLAGELAAGTMAALGVQSPRAASDDAIASGIARLARGGYNEPFISESLEDQISGMRRDRQWQWEKYTPAERREEIRKQILADPILARELERSEREEPRTVRGRRAHQAQLQRQFDQASNWWMGVVTSDEYANQFHDMLREERDRGKRVERVGEALHENWRKDWERQYKAKHDAGAPGFESPRPHRRKPTKDGQWSAAHGGITEVDIYNTPWDDLPNDWQEENREAAKVAERFLSERGGNVDLNDPQTRLEAGEAIHSAWLERHGDEKWEGEDGPTVREGALGRPFAELDEDEQKKDLDQLLIAMRALSGL